MMDAFARSLLETPRHLLEPTGEPRGGLPWTEAKTKPGRPVGKSLEVPPGSIEAAAQSWIIGRITTPVSWPEVAKWYEQTYGMPMRCKTLSVKVHAMNGQPKKRTFWPRKIPDKILQECFVYFALLKAHGVGLGAWELVANRLWKTYRINETPSGIGGKVRVWARAQK